MILVLVQGRKCDFFENKVACGLTYLTFPVNHKWK